MLLVSGVSLPFGNETTTPIKRSVGISSAVGKIYKLCTEILGQLAEKLILALIRHESGKKMFLQKLRSEKNFLWHFSEEK